MENRRLASAQKRALIRRGQITVAPGGRATFDPTAGVRHNDERGHVLIFGAERSEEHTSELQSRLHLVCRLLLEKKKSRTQVRVPKAQAAEASPSIVTRALNLLSSVRFRLTLLVTLAIASMHAMLIVQLNVKAYD